MLPEIFWMAKACDCNPLTAAVIASNRPMTASPQRGARLPSEPKARERVARQSQSPCQTIIPIKSICYKTAAALEGPPRRIFSARERQNLPGRSSGRGYGGRREFQRHAIHAVAQAGRLGTVVEHVAEMAEAAPAVHFGARHEKHAVGLGLDRLRQRLVEARPAGAALEFGVGGEQRQVAAGAGENAFAFFAIERARARALGAVLAQHGVLLGRQALAPLGIGNFAPVDRGAVGHG